SHGRDFARSRQVWRVCDLAGTIICEIAQKEFPGVSYNHGVPRGDPKGKAIAVDAVERWFEENKDRSRDERMFALFSEDDAGAWLRAGEYFRAKNDRRAVAPLLEKIRSGDRNSRRERLCDLVARFGDPQAIPVLQEVLK